MNRDTHYAIALLSSVLIGLIVFDFLRTTLAIHFKHDDISITLAAFGFAMIMFAAMMSYLIDRIDRS